MQREAFTGIIGQLMAVYSDGYNGDTLGTRNNNNESCWGATTIAGRKVYVGRCYTTGPYSGFAHISIQLETSHFPHLIIDADANNHNFTATNLARLLGEDHQYSLEGNFPDYFKVFAANAEIARVSYYVLTPDIMQLLLQQIPTFDIEIIDNTIHTYWQDQALASELNPDWANYLPRAYQLIEQVIAPIVERVEKYKRVELFGQVVEEKLTTNTAALADMARTIIYGKRQNALSATNRHISTSTLIAILLATAVPFLIFIIILVILALIRP